jgi:2-hydroxycyclohexanecarboxyl-CoA dehydrogenase
MGLAGRNAVVTGGASGIGRGISLRLARDGANVAIFDLDQRGAEEVAREVEQLGRRALALEVDVSSSASVGRAVERLHGELGKVQILVNDAGIGGLQPFLQMTAADWDRYLGVHLKGTFNCARALVPDMVDALWGRVVNVASTAGLNGAGPGLTHYAAAKGGIIAFSKALAHEVGAFGVTVNAIAPGMIDTPMSRQSPRADELFARTARHTPIKRVGTPDDIAAACAYLASEEAGFVTGQVLSPNGGGWM